MPDCEAFIKYSNGLQWLGWGGEPEEIATTVLFLASDWTNFITGESIHVTGGFEFGESPKIPNPNSDWNSVEKK